MKLIGKIFIFILILLVLVVLGRNIIIKEGAKVAVKKVTGLPLQMDKFHVGIKESRIHITGLQLHNPAGFEEKVMIDIPEVYVDYNLGAMLTGKVHLEELRFHLKDFNVVRKADGTSNLDSLKALKEAQDSGKTDKPKEEKPKQKTEIQIDNLSLKVDQAQTIVYNDAGQASTKTFNIGLNEEHRNIKSLRSVILMMVLKIALKAPAVASAGNIDVGVLGNVMSGTLGQATKLLGTGTEILGTGAGTATKAVGEVTGAVGEATGAISDTKDKLKGIFGK